MVEKPAEALFFRAKLDKGAIVVPPKTVRRYFDDTTSIVENYQRKAALARCPLTGREWKPIP
jgi:hypothetical protein